MCPSRSISSLVEGSVPACLLSADLRWPQDLPLCLDEADGQGLLGLCLSLIRPYGSRLEDVQSKLSSSRNIE